MSLTHLEHGGWVIADLHRLSIYELEEEAGTLLERILDGEATSEGAEFFEAAVSSGVLVQDGRAANRVGAPTAGQREQEAYRE
ncbi:hypothetical protein BKH36_11740 [Actinomyces naeslundii]|jgi:hypothetical protein|nr:hypothetical protein BKH36_11740 [Actinomyces naeslundii]